MNNVIQVWNDINYVIFILGGINPLGLISSVFLPFLHLEMFSTKHGLWKYVLSINFHPY